MRLLIIFILSPFFLFSQTQIGSDIDGLGVNDRSGNVSISSDGTIVAIGAPGNNYVRVFENSTGYWKQIGNTIYGNNSFDNFGSSVSLSNDGSIIAVGSPDTEVAGYVRIFENNSGVWTQIGDDLIGESEYLFDGWLLNFSFGKSVSLSDDGTILAIGEDRGPYYPWEPQYGRAGFIHMYENISGVWTKMGNHINNLGIHYLNDISISSDGSTVAIFSLGDNPSTFGRPGHVNVFKNTSDVWTQVGVTFYGLGYGLSTINDVSLSDNGYILAIGGSSTKVYENIGNVWTLINDNIELENIYEFPGQVSLSGDGSIVALSGFDNTRIFTRQGFVRIYKNESGTWNKKGDDISGEWLEDFYHNISLSSNGGIIAIGSETNDGNGANSGHVRIYDLSSLLSSEDFVLSQFSLFPNPTKDQFTINLNKNIELDYINIYNYLEQLISSTQETTVSTSHLSSGMYYVEVITDRGKLTKKLVIE